MKTLKEAGLKLSQHWANSSRDAHVMRVGDFLKSGWDCVAEAVNQRQNGVLLYEGHHDFVGTVIPVNFLDEIRRKLPFLEENDPRVDMTEKEFKTNFAAVRQYLKDEKNIVVADENGAPVFALVNKVFSAVHLAIEPEGSVKFTGWASQYLFTDKVFDPKEYEGKPNPLDDLRL